MSLTLLETAIAPQELLSGIRAPEKFDKLRICASPVAAAGRSSSSINISGTIKKS